MTKWSEGRLDNFFVLKRGYDLPNQSRLKGDVPIFSSSGLTDTHNVATVKGPGVITGRYGTIGEVFYSAEAFWPLNTTLYVQDFKGNDPKFIYYYLKDFDFKKFSDKSAVPGINRNHIHEEIIKFPDLTTQQKIVEVLSSIDDKINLLNLQNQTIEQIAETLYRQWFIEEAYTTTALGKVLDLHYGKPLKEGNRKTGLFPVIGSSGVVGFHNEWFVKGPGIVIGRKGTLGVVTYIFEDFFPIDTTYYITSYCNSNGLYYEYFLLRSLNLESMNSDSAVPGLNRNIALASEIPLPRTERVEQFDNFCTPLFEKIYHNKQQIETLQTTLDTLLPKLMHGEIYISDVDTKIDHEENHREREVAY